MISTSSSTRYPWRRANSTDPSPRDDSALLGVPATGDPRPRRNSSRPWSAARRSARRTVLVLTSSWGEVARRRETLSRLRLALGDRPPDLGSDLLVQLGGVLRLTLTIRMTLLILARSSRELSRDSCRPPPQTDADERTLDERVADLEALIEEARQRTRRRRRRNAAVRARRAAGRRCGRVRRRRRLQRRSRRRPTSAPTPAAALTAPARGARRPVRRASGGRRPPPDEAGALYLYAGGRVYRSTDGGRNWKSGPPIALKLDALTVEPRHGSILYAARTTAC